MLTEVQERAIALWRERKSASEITAECGISGASLRRLLRNLDRRGILGPRGPQAVDTAASADTPGVSLFDLRSGMCRYPITGFSAREHRYCGEPQRATGKVTSYCAAHHALCFRPSTKSESRMRATRDKHGFIRLREI